MFPSTHCVEAGLYNGSERRQGCRVVEEYRPTTIGEVRHLVGLLSYYRRYIPNFSHTAKPLYDLLNATNGTKQTNSRNGYLAASTKFSGRTNTKNR